LLGRRLNAGACPVAQAFCNKYFGGRNAVIFAPQQLRELGSDLHLDLEPRFADLAGAWTAENASQPSCSSGCGLLRLLLLLHGITLLF
jgi:hypothetical protein